MNTNLTFSVTPQQFATKLVEWNDRIIRKLGNDVVANLQKANPRDTGYSSGRWLFSRGATPYAVARITNDAPYILVLDGGSSTQAAAGWIGASFQAAVRFLR